MYEKTVEFLAKAMTLIPINYPDSATVKSHYITRCRDAEYDKQVTLSKSSFGPHILCKKCGNPWNDVEKIRIKKTKKFKHQKRLLKKQARPGSKLESIQKKIKRVHLNKLMRICKFCKDITFVEFKKNPPLNTISKLKSSVTETPKVSVMKSTPQTKKNKKRKKDIFAGLNKSVVRQSMTPKKVKNNNTPIKILSETPKGTPKHTVNKLATALKKSTTTRSSIMKLLK